MKSVGTLREMSFQVWEFARALCTAQGVFAASAVLSVMTVLGFWFWVGAGFEANVTGITYCAAKEDTQYLLAIVGSFVLIVVSLFAVSELTRLLELRASHVRRNRVVATREYLPIAGYALLLIAGAIVAALMKC